MSERLTINRLLEEDAAEEKRQARKAAAAAKAAKEHAAWLEKGAPYLSQLETRLDWLEKQVSKNA